MRKKTNAKISSIPKILGGKPLVSGTRIGVEFVLELLSSGWTYEEIMRDYGLKREDILAAIDYAKDSVSEMQTVDLSSIRVKLSGK